MRLLLLLCCCLLGACAYRMVQPTAPGDGVRLEISADDSRMPHIRRSLQQALAKALVEDLGWRINPQASTLLVVDIDREEIASAATSGDNITSSWRLTVAADVELRGLGEGDPQRSRQSAEGTYQSLNNEVDGIERCSEVLAERITSWLLVVTTAR